MTEIQFTLTGNLVADPELRFAPDGSAVANLAIAVTPRIKRGDSYVDGETTFVRGALWGQYAENVAGSLEQGQRVHASGILRTRKYTDPTTGEIKSVLEAKFNDVSPDLRFATARVTKASRTQTPAVDQSGTDEYHQAVQNLRAVGAQPVEPAF